MSHFRRFVVIYLQHAIDRALADSQHHGEQVEYPVNTRVVGAEGHRDRSVVEMVVVGDWSCDMMATRPGSIVGEVQQRR